jgi:glycosyltransferase involved in cell wall biosynthesis
MPRILFIAIHRLGRSPSQRFRFEQYLGFLNEKGWEYDFSFLISEKDDHFFYQKGYVFQKALIFIKSIFIRLKNLRNISDYDVVFIQREAFFTGTTFFERRLSKSKAKIVYDFDDSIWLPNVSDGNKKLKWLKDEHKTKNIILISDLVIAGNEYLSEYALKFNNNVVVIPTTIDFNYHKITNVSTGDKVTIGWTGTSTTLPYLEAILPIFEKLIDKYNDKVTFKIIVDVDKKYESIGTQTILWNKQNEIEELNGIDIGIMPLPNNQWTRGKCGFKGLQYMALGKATIMAPVGVNTEIVQDGENGFLAKNDEEWFDKLSTLIESKTLRNKIGENAKRTVENRFSVSSQKMKYLNEFEKLIQA